MAEEKKICPTCRMTNMADARFCDNCGRPLEETDMVNSDDRSHQIITVDASSGGVVAVGSGAKAVRVGQGGIYIEQQERQSNEKGAGASKDLKRCPECENEVMEQAQYCQHCGAKL